jgi:5-methylcytosine-specific restriction protein B
MAPKPVEAVFFFRWDKQTSQATYHRISESSRYTKNYLQVSGEAGDVLDEVFGRTGDQEVRLMWRWPHDQGGQPGKLRLHKGESGSAKRVHLTWDSAGKAPKTWKLGNPEKDPLVSIPGDPDGITVDRADAAIAEVTAADLRPWFVAVKLEGEDNELHARAFLENPPDDLMRTDIARLPAGLLAEIDALGPQSGVFRPVHSPPLPVRAPKILAAVQAALEKDPNVLLVGPPGTGKTVALEDLRAMVEHTDAPLSFDSDLVDDAFGDDAENAGKVVSLVFHSSFSYENFVAGLVPRSEDGALRLEAQPGPLLNLATWAAGSKRRALLLLDEFNRGPTAAIFGDTLALLDGSKRATESGGGAHIARPFADQEMTVPREYANSEGSVEVPPELRLPANLHIVAALNSSDRSVAPLDAALRRRFAIIRVDPDLELLAEHFRVDLPDQLPAWLGEDPETWGPDEIRILALLLLAALNERIKFILGDDFVLGHALLWPVGEAPDDVVHTVLCAAFDQKIVQSLRLSFTDQDDLLAAVLGAGTPDSAPPVGGAVALWRQPPAAVEEFAQPHLEVRSIAAMPWSDAGAALRAVVQGVA